jgi:hypothetical protein
MLNYIMLYVLYYIKIYVISRVYHAAWCWDVARLRRRKLYYIMLYYIILYPIL